VALVKTTEQQNVIYGSDYITTVCTESVDTAHTARYAEYIPLTALQMLPPIEI